MQAVILLRLPAQETAIETEFRLEGTRHLYRVIKIWEQSPDIFLQNPALLPLAVLTATQPPEQLLGQIAQQVSRIESTEQRQEVICTQLLAGLRFSIVLRLLNRRVGTIAPELQSQIQALSLSQLEDSGEALLDSNSADLMGWLENHSTAF